MITRLKTATILPMAASAATVLCAALIGAATGRAEAPIEKHAAAAEAFDIEARKQSHWAWSPIRSVEPPEVRNSKWPLDRLDAFVLARLEETGLPPAPSADRRILLRRLYFDLIGLPPSPAEIEAFLSDTSPDAYEEVVDYLLASPHFGERWGRHWLDLIRFAETYGHEFDYDIPQAWHYRDYVIRALNADVPYDQFVIEHIAGDLMPDPRRHPTDGYNESIIGTGFWWLSQGTHAPVDVRQDETARVDNQIDVFSKTFLGLTVACARCHDHKFDAISTKDFYALAGYLQSSRRQHAFLDPHGRISASRARCDAAYAEGSIAFRDALLPSDENSAEDFTRYLRAAQRVHEGVSRPATDGVAGAGAVRNPGASRAGASLRSSPGHPTRISEGTQKKAAKPVAPDIESQRLARWIAALRDEALSSNAHPLAAWHGLAAVDADEATPLFARRRDQLLSELSGPVRRAATSEASSIIFEDFHDPASMTNWYASGHAFGQRPVRPGEWDPMDDGQRVFTQGMVHSGRLGRRFQGVLRSRTFELKHPYIQYRVAGEGGQIRVIIDGYTLDTASQLLFKDVRFPVDTKGQFTWRTQGGDLSRYIGHRVHLEIKDEGDGWIAVDEIRFSDRAAAPKTVNTVALAVLDDPSVESRRTLALAYGRIMRRSIDRISSDDRDVDPSEAALVNWMMEHGLVDVDPKLRDAVTAQATIIQDADQQMPRPTRVLAMADGSGEDEYVFVRGQHQSRGPLVRRRFLVALSGDDRQTPAAGSGRLELAQRVVGRDNPLPARVMVNRVWHHLFGRGIVPTTDDFGVLGQPPSHPRLLDDLADWFQNGGRWSVKRLIRKIVFSRTYRMASRPADRRAEEADPDNTLLHRMRVRRLEGEVIRDAVLSISGQLDRQRFGFSVPVHLSPFMTGRGRPKQSGPIDGNGRRSIYISVRRNFLPPMFLAFDMPLPHSTVGRRSVSNVPAQALTMMNDRFVMEQAHHWAERLLQETEPPRVRIVSMFVSSFGREPTGEEIGSAMEFLDTQARAYGTSDLESAAAEDAWADLCHVLFNVKEFVFVK